MNGKVTPIAGVLNMSIKVEGVPTILSVKVVRELEHDLIFGIDFCQEFGIEVRFAEGRWRSNEGEWRSFAKTRAIEQPRIFAECAGIAELADDQRTIIEKLVLRVLPSESESPGLTNLIEHHIDVQGATPVRHKMRRMSPKMLEFAQGEVKKLRRVGIIERSASDWRSAPVVSWRNDKGRLCYDYRDVNKCIKKGAYVLPNMDSILDKLRNAKYISKIDLQQAYYQVPVER